MQGETHEHGMRRHKRDAAQRKWGGGGRARPSAFEHIAYRRGGDEAEQPRLLHRELPGFENALHSVRGACRAEGGRACCGAGIVLGVCSCEAASAGREQPSARSVGAQPVRRQVRSTSALCRGRRQLRSAGAQDRSSMLLAAVELILGFCGLSFMQLSFAELCRI